MDIITNGTSIHSTLLKNKHFKPALCPTCQILSYSVLKVHKHIHIYIIIPHVFTMACIEINTHAFI